MESCVGIACIALALCSAPRQAAQATELDRVDYRVLQVCEGVIRLFEQPPVAVWPGYNPLARPLVVYRAKRWALLLGHEGGAEGFAAYPSDWPDLNHPAHLHMGPHEKLAGQLVFDFPIGDAKGVAIGVPAPDEVSRVPGLEGISFEAVILGYIVHEAFHQYQSEEFGEIPWAREEKYPILHAENSALACLEMRLLIDALRAAQGDSCRGCEEAAGRFVAVRLHRWKQAPRFVEHFERGLELREGTAKYVETRAVDLASGLQYRSRVPADKPLAKKLTGLSAASLLLMDFRGRFTDGAVSPDDMPRNRVYPVAGTLCYLLDYLGVDWKPAAQRAGADFSYVELLRRRLAVDDADLDRLVADAKDRCAYDKMVTTTNALIEKYRVDFAEALVAFEAQSGQRLEVTLSTNGLSRSRVSTARKWLMDGGRRSLCARYKVYVLTRAGIRLQVESSGVLELDDWDTRTRTAVCFARGKTEVTLDGKPVTLEDDRVCRFDQITLNTENVTLECSKPGTIRRSGQRLMIDVRPGVTAGKNP